MRKWHELFVLCQNTKQKTGGTGCVVTTCSRDLRNGSRWSLPQMWYVRSLQHHSLVVGSLRNKHREDSKSCGTSPLLLSCSEWMDFEIQVKNEKETESCFTLWTHCVLIAANHIFGSSASAHAAVRLNCWSACLNDDRTGTSLTWQDW